VSREELLGPLSWIVEIQDPNNLVSEVEESGFFFLHFGASKLRSVEGRRGISDKTAQSIATGEQWLPGSVRGRIRGRATMLTMPETEETLRRQLPHHW